MSRQVWLNGKLVSEQAAKVSIFDYGFLFGCGLFETMRAYQGRVFRLERHLERLKTASMFLNISFNGKEQELHAAIYTCLSANKLNDAYIRLNVWKGEGETGLKPETCGRINMAVITKPFTPYPSRFYKEGMEAVVVNTRRGEDSPLSRMKTFNYLNNILARQAAKEAGADEGIFLNYAGNLACGTVSNIFLVKEGVVSTPSLDDGILNGITRKAIIELAHRHNIEIREESITLSQLKNADEAFLTNTLMEVMPLTSIDGFPIKDGVPGKFTKAFFSRYKELVTAEASSLSSM